jgi:hypothetical protein
MIALADPVFLASARLVFGRLRDKVGPALGGHPLGLLPPPGSDFLMIA